MVKNGFKILSVVNYLLPSEQKTIHPFPFQTPNPALQINARFISQEILIQLHFYTQKFMRFEKKFGAKPKALCSIEPNHNKTNAKIFLNDRNKLLTTFITVTLSLKSNNFSAKQLKSKLVRFRDVCNKIHQTYGCQRKKRPRKATDLEKIYT